MKKKVKANTPIPEYQKEANAIWIKLQLDLKYWQRQLRLDDVDIELRWLQWDEHPDKVGYFDDASAAQLFEIGLRHPYQKQTMPCVREFNGDYEVILVHELLHARYSRWYSGEVVEILSEGVSNELFEVSIDAIAEALVRARRGITR